MMAFFIPMGPVFGALMALALGVGGLACAVNAVIVRTSFFPNFFHAPRVEYQRKKAVKAVKRKAAVRLKAMTPAERADTDWTVYARDLLREEACDGLSVNELYRFIRRAMHERGPA